MAKEKKLISPATKKKAVAKICELCAGTLNEDDYNDKYIQAEPCKHYMCEAHANNMYGANTADWRAAAEARKATILPPAAAADG